MKKGSPKVKVRFLATEHFSTVGAMQKGQVVEVDPDEAQRIMDKWPEKTERVSEPTPAKKTPAKKAKGK